MKEVVHRLLTELGEDPSREGLLSTPKRVVKAFREYFKGYTEDPTKFLSKEVSTLKLLFQVSTTTANMTF